AGANNRIAFLDTAVDADAATLEALAATLSANANARYAALWAPPAICPGVTSADTRTVAWAAIQAGMTSRAARTMSPNVPVAGVNGISRFALDLTTRFIDADRESLNEAGVNLARVMYGQVMAYGYRTLAPDSTGWLSLANARLNMEIVAKAEAIGERFVFSQI